MEPKAVESVTLVDDPIVVKVPKGYGVIAAVIVCAPEIGEGEEAPPTNTGTSMITQYISIGEFYTNLSEDDTNLAILHMIKGTAEVELAKIEAAGRGKPDNATTH